MRSSIFSSHSSPKSDKLRGLDYQLAFLMLRCLYNLFCTCIVVSKHAVQCWLVLSLQRVSKTPKLLYTIRRPHLNWNIMLSRILYVYLFLIFLFVVTKSKTSKNTITSSLTTCKYSSLKTRLSSHRGVREKFLMKL